MIPADRAAPAAPEPRPQASGRRRQLGVWLLAGLLLASTVSLGLTFWLMRSETGSRWLLTHAPGLEVDHTQGALLGPSFTAQGLRWRALSGSAALQIDQLSWQGARWTFLPGTGAWLGLRIEEFRAGAVRWTSASDRLQAPRSLRTPVDLELTSLHIASLQVDAAEPARDIQARLSLGREAGTEHRIDLQELRWQHIKLQGTGTLKADLPNTVNLQLQAQAQQGLPWSAQAELQGPLSSSSLRLKILGKAIDKGPDPSLEAQAQIRPFESWALGAVDLTTHQFDLAALLPGAPRTRLSGHATVRSQGRREPISADIELDNAAPARFSDGGLPFLALRATLKADPRQPDRLDIGPFVLDAADSRGAAGRWSGSGTWQGDQLELQTRLIDLQPSRLDQRLAAMQLGGPLRIKLLGLPSPNPAAAQTPTWSGWQALSLQAEGALEGRIPSAPQDVRLSFNGSADRAGVRLQSLLASSGSANARLSAEIKRSGPQRWQITSEGELKSFDPRVWFPGPDATWGPGQYLFNGRWALDIHAPGLQTTTSLAQWLPLLLGRADVKLLESRVAGLPMQADLELRQDLLAGAGAAPSRAKADIRLGSAQLQISGAGDAGEAGVNDRTQVKLYVPALGEMAPLFKLWPDAGAWTPRRGDLQLQADLTGRWPDLHGSIEASASQVEAGSVSLARGQLNGQIDRQRKDGLLLRLEADELRWHDAQIQAVRGQVRGSVGQHQISLTVQAPLIPPQLLATALQWRQSGQTRAELVGRGSWTGSPGDRGLAGRWTGQLEQLKVGNQPKAESASPDASWLDVQGVTGEMNFDTHGQLLSLQLQPGVARSGPLTLRWTEAQWQAVANAPSAWRLLGELEPVAVAPMLRRTVDREGGGSQWAGDLRVGARIDLRADSRFEADVLLQRESGDLTANDGSTQTALELEKAELRWQVKEGVWRFRPEIQGRSFGRLSGELVAQAQPSQRWPLATAPIAGTLDARIASLAAWGRWLPAGWTLQGEFDGTARLSGTWGNPAYTGSLKGERVAVRNLLQGVDLKDGRLQVLLDGDSARIEALSIRGGEGQLTAQGQARFGSKPELQLEAKAVQLRVLARVDRQLIISGQTRLSMNTDRLSLDGQIKADSGLFDLSSRDAPTLDEDVVILRPTSTPSAPPAQPQPSAWARQARVTLDLDLGPQLRLKGRGLNTGLTGKLRLTTPNGRPSFQGAVLASGGTYEAYGQKLAIERGLVNFNGPLDRARLDILALRPNLDMRVGVLITGSALEPRVRLFSEPEMGESDKLSWLVLGRGPEGLGTTDTALLQRAAMALLAGEGESPTDAALRRLGLDDFSIRQSDGDVRDTVVSVGKQLGRRWYVGYERGVNATAGTWQLVYRIAQRFTLRAQSGSDNSLDMIWTWRFGQP